MPELSISAERVREAVLALEGTVISDLTIPLPGDLLDISKAASLVSGVVEDRIPELLNRVRTQTWDEDGALHAYEFRRMTIGFPDIQLVERSNPDHFIFEMEAKSWYILSSDAMTARFLTAADAVRDGTLIVLVAWMLDGIVSGSPKLMRIHIDDAKHLAEVRDEYWTDIQPPDTHRVVQPVNDPHTPRSLWKTQAVGQMRSPGGAWAGESDNFGKLARIHDPGVESFAATVFGLRAAGKTLGRWRDFVTESPARAAKKAAKAVKAAKKAGSPLFP